MKNSNETFWEIFKQCGEVESINPLKIGCPKFLDSALLYYGHPIDKGQSWQLLPNVCQKKSVDFLCDIITSQLKAICYIVNSAIWCIIMNGFAEPAFYEVTASKNFSKNSKKKENFNWLKNLKE